MKLTAKEAVEAQMNALAQNDHPRVDHGLEVRSCSIAPPDSS